MTASPSPFDNRLLAFADDERRAANARTRLQRADRALTDALSATFTGTLTELAETRAPVTVLTRTESAIRGTVVVLGSDAIVVQSDKNATEILIRTASIEGLLMSGAGHHRSVANSDDRPGFAELLDQLGEHHTRFALTMQSGNRVMGSVDHIGQDQLSLTLDGRGDTMTVPIAAIDQVGAAK